jgi:hypothetical protein
MARFREKKSPLPELVAKEFHCFIIPTTDDEMTIDRTEIRRRFRKNIVPF